MEIEKMWAIMVPDSCGACGTDKSNWGAALFPTLKQAQGFLLYEGSNPNGSSVRGGFIVSVPVLTHPHYDELAVDTPGYWGRATEYPSISAVQDE